jgi:hypothetical protein
MNLLTLDQQKKRLENIRISETDAKVFRKKIRIGDYLAGQVIYNLGDYPAKFSIEPTEYDFHLIKRLAASGAKLIQVHEEWNDAIRIHGADKWSSHDPAGMRKFIELCHYFGIKIIPYCSSSYIHEFDPEFREEFTRSTSVCQQIHHKYRIGWAGSAEWRNFIIRKTLGVLDTYNFDGLFNDMGYDGKIYVRQEVNGKIEKSYLTEFPYDPEVEDLLCTIYSEVKRMGGVYKYHIGSNLGPPCKEKVYDYLWVGEGMNDIKQLQKCRDYAPYVVPAVDKQRAVGMIDYDFIYAQSIPYVQFPLLMHGRPLTGRSVEVAGITYYGQDDPNSEFNMKKRVGEFYRQHPDGPYTYTEWGSIPDDPSEFDRWSEYLALYLPMVTDGSIARTEIHDTALIASPILQDIVFSLFVNDQLYMTISNLSDKPYDALLRDIWQDRKTGETASKFTVAPGIIKFLQMNAPGEAG